MRTFAISSLLSIVLLILRHSHATHLKINVINDESIDILKNGEWILFAHSSTCNDSYCNLFKHVWHLLSQDSDIQAAGLQLAILNADQYRISRLKLDATGTLPQIFFIQNGRIFKSMDSFGSVEDLKRFALNRGKNLVSSRTLDDRLAHDYAPSTSGLSSLIILFIGTTIVAYLIKGGFFRSCSLKEIAKSRRRKKSRYNSLPTETVYQN